MGCKSPRSIPTIHKKKPYKHRTQKHTHLLLLLCLLIIIINKVQDFNSALPLPKQSISATFSALRSMTQIKNKTRKERRKSRKNTETKRKSDSEIILMLLIMSGNVHVNPGPVEESPSRYKLIVNIIEKLSPKKTDIHPREYNDNQNNINELTQISPKDYIGVDTCSSCYKEVKLNQQAVLCDKCERWIHRRCSDMKISTYQENCTKKNFKWVCNVCRNDDPENSDRVDTSILKKDELPDNYNMLSYTKNEMLIIHLNARSIVNKQDEFQLLCQQLKPDIICVTETWMDEHIPKQSLTPPGYKVLRKDRSEEFKQVYGKNKGGGIAVYYKKELKLERKEIVKDEHEEILWVQVRAKKSFLLGIIYRSEYTDMLKEDNNESKFEKHILKATEVSSNIVLIGDFNADLTKGRTCSSSTHIKTVCKNYGLSQYIKKPTRVDTTHRKATLIDHIWANKENKLINKCGTIMGLSDHLAVYAKLNIQRGRKPEEIIRYRSYRTYVQADFNQELCEKLSESNVQSKIDVKNLNGAMKTFLKIYKDTADKHAPIKECKMRPEKLEIPWFTEELKNKIHLKNERLRDWYMYGDKNDYKAVKKLKNEVNHMKVKLKKQYYKEKFSKCEGDAKKTWKILKEITGTVNSKETTEPENMSKEKANKFNKFFATVGTEIQKRLKVMQHRLTFNGQAGFIFI